MVYAPLLLKDSQRAGIQQSAPARTHSTEQILLRIHHPVKIKEVRSLLLKDSQRAGIQQSLLLYHSTEQILLGIHHPVKIKEVRSLLLKDSQRAGIQQSLLLYHSTEQILLGNFTTLVLSGIRDIATPAETHSQFIRDTRTKVGPSLRVRIAESGRTGNRQVSDCGFVLDVVVEKYQV
ncbi:hypothetical protein J6590_079356 [Homalodisca vitripennis]|nr:hypothetical protein J6590_079356 [Homalodisca vitripennis]